MKRQIELGLEGNFRPFPKDQSYLHRILKKVGSPEKDAYIFLREGEGQADRLTYGNLHERARRIAGILQSLATPGDRALLLHPFGLDFVSAFYGCLFSGIVAVPACPPRNRTLFQLDFLVEDSRPSFILCQSAQMSMLTQWMETWLPGKARVSIIATDTVNPEYSERWVCPRLNRESLAFLQYTSGSTSAPRGVMVSHENLLVNEHLLQTSFQTEEDSVIVSWLPGYHDMGLVGTILQAAFCEASCVLLSPLHFVQDPFRWLKAISDFQGTISGGPNFGYELCMQKIRQEQLASIDLSHWRVAFTGAEPVRYRTLERFTQYFRSCGFQQASWLPGYGLAEATLMVTSRPNPGDMKIISADADALQRNQVVLAENNRKGRHLVSCGQPGAGYKVKIADPASQVPCSDGQVGEIWISGKSVAQGYWNKPVLTRDTFQARLKGYKKNFLRTGDLGFLLKDELYITGRLKDTIIIRGLNHYPQDIELTVEQSHLGLRRGGGAAISVDANNEEVLVILHEVERKHLCGDTAEILESIKKAVVDEHEMRAHTIVLLKPGTLPKTTSGKIQRHLCRQAFLNGTFNPIAQWTAPEAKSSPNGSPACSAVFPAGARNDAGIVTKSKEIEEWLISWLVARTGISKEEVDVTKSLLQYGLDSINGMKLAFDLENWLGFPCLPTLGFDHPSIQECAGYLSRQFHSKSTHGGSMLHRVPGPDQLVDARSKA